MAPLQVSQGGNASAAAEPSPAAANQDASLKPWRVLDGFGKLGEPGERAQAIPAAKIDKTRAGPSSPAGLYGPQNALRAINAVAAGDTLAALKTPANARVSVFSEAKTIALAPWLFLAALRSVPARRSGVRPGRWQGPDPVAQASRGGALRPAFSSALLSQGARAETQPANNAAAFALQASLETHLAYVVTGNAEADRISQAGLSGLSKILTARTAVEPGEPMAVDPARDELVFFPLIYWPVLPNAEPLPDKVLAKVDAYMKQGGLIIFDTKNDDANPGALLSSGVTTPLSQLLGKLDLPPLQRVPEDHVLTKSFYLLQSFPGRWDNGDPWVEARSDTADATKRAVKSDGVSSIIVTSNDLAAAWALDDDDRPMFAMVPGGEDQREMSYRVGVNIVMYALTGNYKSDQVHVPAILERLGH